MHSDCGHQVCQGGLIIPLIYCPQLYQNEILLHEIPVCMNHTGSADEIMARIQSEIMGLKAPPSGAATLYS